MPDRRRSLANGDAAQIGARGLPARLAAACARLLRTRLLRRIMGEAGSAETRSWRRDLTFRVRSAGRAIKRRQDESRAAWRGRVQEARAHVLGLPRLPDETTGALSRRIAQSLAVAQPPKINRRGSRPAAVDWSERGRRAVGGVIEGEAAPFIPEPSTEPAASPIADGAGRDLPVQRSQSPQGASRGVDAPISTRGERFAG
jgi:hypothetical protein